MLFLLDTNVISELVEPFPAANVTTFLANLRTDSLFTSSICEAEIRYGLARMPVGHRSENLSTRMDALLAGFDGRVRDFDRHCAAAFGRLKTHREKIGRPIAFADAMIAATALTHRAVVVTRNVSDFDDCDLDVRNP